MCPQSVLASSCTVHFVHKPECFYALSKSNFKANPSCSHIDLVVLSSAAPSFPFPTPDEMQKSNESNDCLKGFRMQLRMRLQGFISSHYPNRDIYLFISPYCIALEVNLKMSSSCRFDPFRRFDFLRLFSLTLEAIQNKL